MIKKNHIARISRLKLVLNQKLGFYNHLHGSFQIVDGFDPGLQADFVVYLHRNAEPEVFDSVIDFHFHIPYLGNLFPEIRDQRKRQVTVRYRRLVWPLLSCSFFVHMNPLMVQGSIRKAVDLLLVDGMLGRSSGQCALQFFVVPEIIDNYHFIF